MEPYLVVVILNPTKKARDEEGEIPQIVVPATTVLAKNEGSAIAKAMKLVPEEHANKDERLEVRVLPFVRVGALAGAR